MPFGNHLLLNKQWHFGYVLSLNIRWRFGNKQSLSVRRRFGENLLLNIHWNFWRPLIALTKTIELVAFIRLEGVNYVFSHVSLYLVATFLF
jgi:hypothetical protein